MNAISNTSRIEDRFLKAMNDEGLFPEGPIFADGAIRRFPTKDRRGDDAGWYVLNAGPPAHGAFGCHREGLQENWVDDSSHYPKLEAGDFQERQFMLRRESRNQRIAMYEKAMAAAFGVWKDANDDPASHPYLLRKNVGAYGLRRKGEELLMPLYNEESELCSLLKIQPDGTKRFLSGGRVSGCFHLIGAPGPTICIAEGYATAATIHESTGLPVYVASSANNLAAVASYARRVHFDSTIILCADDDYQTEGNPGLEKATQAARNIGARVAVPDFCAFRPDGATDFNDLENLSGRQAIVKSIEQASYPPMGESGEMRNQARLWLSGAERAQGEVQSGLAKTELALAMQRAREILLSGIRPEAEYPVDALGPLAQVCRTISQGVQVNVAIVGQSLLAAASVIVQSTANVRTAESTKPLSLYMLTIAESGDGKSTAEHIALAAVSEYQRSKSAEYRQALEDYEIALKSKRKKGEPPPLKPRQPYVLVRDATVEGIRRSFLEGRPSQGVFTSEAATMLHGYGMSAEHRAKTAANFSNLWDTGELSVARSTGERVQLYDRRFAMHWMIQPSAAAEGLTDPLLTEIGLWPRFMVAWAGPGSPRKWAPFEANKDPAIGAYWKRCTELLDRPVRESCVDLPEIRTDSAAMHTFAEFFEITEQRAKGRSGDLQEVRVFASRATEMALRVAGVLAVFAGEEKISEKTAQNAVALVEYSLSTWLAIQGEKSNNEDRLRAVKLYGWMLGRPNLRSDTTAILRIGPKALRSRARRDAALSLLKQAGLIMIDHGEVYAVVAKKDPQLKIEEV